jgi:hypothetical protein
MRYLNKIVFINSASVKYAEIELDGNVHLIGTQGVGKSTLLRAILFFYNANKTKLGIPREKKGFDDYYFGYQNSYIIYEVLKDSVAYCVLAYKTNGKVAFRFFNSEYKRSLFIDATNRAFESWDNIRGALGKEIYYTSLVTSYEDFRKIIYGDHSGLKPDFRKYALIESKQYQNIPRTIQNVLLNSNLEAKFIKDTIINSLNEDEFTIDIENYSKNHLREFESNINDLNLWFKKNKKGQILVRKQAERVIDRFQIIKFLKREKRALASELATRIEFVEREKPGLASNYSKENDHFTELFTQKSKLENLHKKREQKAISDIDHIKKELLKATQKEKEYEIKNIKLIIQKVAKKSALLIGQKNSLEEKHILTSKFTEIEQRYQALISQNKNHLDQFENGQFAEINRIDKEYADQKNLIITTYNDLIKQIVYDHKQEKEIASNQLLAVLSDKNKFTNKKAELKHKTFYTDQIEVLKEEKKELANGVLIAQSIIRDFTSNIVNLRKEWGLETQEIERKHKVTLHKEHERIKKIQVTIASTEKKIKHTDSSFYGWLNDNLPDWHDTIGKVVDEDHVLFHTELHPELVERGGKQTIFGVSLNLNNLKTRVKTVAAYLQEIKDGHNQITGIEKQIQHHHAAKETDVSRLKTRFKKKLNKLKTTIAEKEYAVAQSNEKLKSHSIALEDWVAKDRSEKKSQLEHLDHRLEEIALLQSKAQEEIDRIKKGIKRRISSKENQQEADVSALEKIKNNKIKDIQRAIEHHKNTAHQRKEELKKEQLSELHKKGADTSRLLLIDQKLAKIDSALEYIQENEILVVEFNKDKREVFNLMPSWKGEKTSLEKKRELMEHEHALEIHKLDEKQGKQRQIVIKIKGKLEVFEADIKRFEDFKISEVFADIRDFYIESKKENQNQKNAAAIIQEITDKFYKEINTFKELQQAINAFNGNFNEVNVFKFNVKLNEDDDYLNFADNLKEFIEEDKINDFEKRVNERFANIIHLIGRETTELNSKKGEIEKIIKKINDDFIGKNFVQAIKAMEMKTLESSNPVVKLLIRIKEFNDENSLALGATNLFTSGESSSKNQHAIDLIKQLVKELRNSKSSVLTLSESFDLQFRIIENDNDSGWVEKLSNVGSEGTDVLVKAMINILLLNVFKDSASKKFKDFKLHCMMDEIGRLHPNNVKGILRFANERNILLINGSPTSQNATDYKYTYRLAKEPSETHPKKYITKINRLVKVNPKVTN